MEPINQIDLHQDCLAKLSRALDLVLKTAETASAENNHKIVIQAAREVTLIASLIAKMTDPKTKASQAFTVANPGKPVSQLSSAPADPKLKPEVTDLKAQDLMLPDLETFFPAHDVASWDSAAQDMLKDIAENYQELQSWGTDIAAGLPEPKAGPGKSA